MRVWFRRTVKSIIKFLIRLLLRMEVRGLEHLPAEGPVVLAISHTNFLDPVLAMAVCPRPLEAVSKIENFRLFFLGPLIRWYGVISIRRGEVDRKALSTAIEVLERGEVLLIAPEGTRSGIERLQKGRGGLAFIAGQTGALIVPMGIIGVERFWCNLVLLRRTPVEVVLGQPFRFAPRGRPLDRQALAQMTIEAMYQLAAILPPKCRGRYGDLVEATEDWLEFPGGVSNLMLACEEVNEPALAEKVRVS